MDSGTTPRAPAQDTTAGTCHDERSRRTNVTPAATTAPIAAPAIASSAKSSGARRHEPRRERQRGQQDGDEADGGRRDHHEPAPRE
ncbi:hypothetical protein AB0L65_34310 [Nonomuraea sp. NPDC052116]|uniref:hypothetical protein n=1 Tax=Nonomuraea sp. NPDC052116 TaxID=3155665 RepID=UPI0034228D61